MEQLNYENAINLITSREKFHICLGLDRIAKILNLLGNPQDKLKIIHIAGTNGKGSTCAMLSWILTCAGYKTGLYTSPHILEYTERIRINQRNISKMDFADLIFEITNLANENDIYLTEFELLTVCAFKYFVDKETDICIIETGLGGRLDATNVAKQSLLSVITSISLDHVDRLGNAIEQIAFEKAGIIKKGCPVLISDANKGYNIVAEVAKNLGANCLIPKNKCKFVFDNGTNYTIINEQKYEFALLGLWQKENLELVCAVVDYLNNLGYQIFDDAFKKALATIHWSCRMQYISKYNLLFDGTHNPDGARVLRESLDYYFPNKKIVWVYGALTTKDYSQVMQNLFDVNDEVYFYNFDYPNAVDFVELKKHVPQAKSINLRELEYLVMENKSALVVVSGSFYMIGQIFNSSNFFQNIAEVVNIY